MVVASNLIHRHKRLLIMSYGAIAILAIIGLLMNVKTVPVNDEIRKTKQKIQIVRDDNERKRLELAKLITLRTVEQRAETTLGMRYPDSVIYIDSNGHLIDQNGVAIPKVPPSNE